MHIWPCGLQGSLVNGGRTKEIDAQNLGIRLIPEEEWDDIVAAQGPAAQVPSHTLSSFSFLVVLASKFLISIVLHSAGPHKHPASGHVGAQACPTMRTPNQSQPQPPSMLSPTPPPQVPDALCVAPPLLQVCFPTASSQVAPVSIGGFQPKRPATASDDDEAEQDDINSDIDEPPVTAPVASTSSQPAPKHAMADGQVYDFKSGSGSTNYRYFFFLVYFLC